MRLEAPRRPRLVLAAALLLPLLAAALLAPLLATDWPLLWWEEGSWPRSPALGSLLNPRFHRHSLLDLGWNAALVTALALLPLLPLLRRLPRRWRPLLALLVLLPALRLAGQERLWPADYASRAAEITEARTPSLAGRRGPLLWVRAPLYSPVFLSRSELHCEPSWLHPLGTNGLGIDNLSLLLHGARFSLGLALVVTAVSTGLGILLGGLAGYAGGPLDALLLRTLAVVRAVPGLLLVLALDALLGREHHLLALLLALVAVRWAEPARILRASVLSLKGRAFVEAARVAGLGRLHILFRELLPNAVAPLLPVAVLGVSGCVLAETTVSFLGLGPDRLQSWGQMIAEARRNGTNLELLAPAAALFALLLGLHLLAEELKARLAGEEEP